MSSGADGTTGNISITAKLSNKNDLLIIGLDHAFLKEGVYAAPGDPGAHQIGFLTAGIIADGETKTFEVGTGTHEIQVGNEIYGSEPLEVKVLPGKTTKVLCGDNFDGLTKAFYSVYYLFHREIPGRFYYFVRQID